jgi:uncharacterized repeat protein (TIGR03843 family)
VTDLKVIGQMSDASNATLVAEDSQGNRFIYKPVLGERPLWDFPDGTLAARERSAYVLSELLQWNTVPHTRLVEGPHGIGSVQDWIDAEVLAVDVVPPDSVKDGWLKVFDGVDGQNNPVALVHQDTDDLMRIAVFDILANNADRKGGHLLTTAAGETFGIDHGVTFHEDPKLRTVLWGWVGTEIPENFVRDIKKARTQVTDSELSSLLTPTEVTALIKRMQSLIDNPQMPAPSGDWPAIPWPVF